MGKIINTFKHGASDVKRLLLGTILAGIATAGLFAAAFFTSMMVCFFGGVAMFFVTVAMAQTMGIREDIHNKNKAEAGVHEKSGINGVQEAKPVSNDFTKASQQEESDTSLPDFWSNDEVYETNGVEEQPVHNSVNTVNSNQEMSSYGNVEDINRLLQNLESYTEKLDNHISNISETIYNQNSEFVDDMDELTQSISESNKKKKDKKKKIKNKKKRNKDTQKAEVEAVESTTEKTAKKKKAKKVKIKKQKELVKNDINQTHISITPEETERLDMPADQTVRLNYMDTANGDARFNFEAKSEMEDEKTMLLTDASTDEEVTEPVKIVQIDEETVKTYDRKKIKKTMHKYKVKRDHRMVMVDHCEKLNILQTPAYIWVDKNIFNLLLIESEPRIITFPLYSLNQITYVKKMPANEYSEYQLFRSAGGMLVDLFRPYLPDYAHSTVVGDMSAFKNLYGIGPGIYFTNTSASSLFDLLNAEFAVKDKVTESNKVNVYFKEAYKANIKLRDNVIDANGYADSISSILDNLARSTISYNEFKETLNLMIKNKLITQEFAMHYMDVRDKLSR